MDSLTQRPLLSKKSRGCLILLIGTVICAAILVVGDILVDFAEGESGVHIGVESLFLSFFLFLFLYSVGNLFMTPRASGAPDSRRTQAILIASLLGLLWLTADDAFSVLEGTTETTEYLETLVRSQNLHEVVPGRFFRAGQMKHDDFRRTLTLYGISTVIDLRFGDDDPDAYGKTEADISFESNVRYEHVRLLSSKLPPLASVELLLDLFKRAELPILVHCSGGAHRTSFASAIWLLEQEGKSKSEAARQLSPRFGFFRWERKIKSYLRGEPTLDSLLWRYIEDPEATKPFREWVREQLVANVPDTQGSE